MQRTIHWVFVESQMKNHLLHIVKFLPCALVGNCLSLIDGVGFVCTNSAEDVRKGVVVDLSVTSGVGTEDLVGSLLTVKRVGGIVVDFKP